MRRAAKFALLVLALSLAAFAPAEDNPTDLLNSGHVDQAIALLQKQTAAAPNDAVLQNLLCRAYYYGGDWDRAIAAGEKSVTLAASNSEYYHWLGRAYGEKADSSGPFSAFGWARKTRTAFEKAVALDGANVSARVDLSEFYYEAPGIVGGGEDKARAQADALMKLDPVKGHSVLARIAQKHKDFTVAEREFQAALDASQGDAEAWLNLAQFYRYANRLQEMESALEKLNAAPLKSPEVLLDAAQLLLRAERNFPRAADFVHRYLAGKTVEDGPVFRARFLLGNLFEKQGDKQSAANEYRAALALSQNYKPAREGLKRVS